jgi:FkbM family methyltransferase
VASLRGRGALARFAGMMEPYGARAPGWFDSTVIAATSRLPDNWLGLRLAIGLRRAVTMRVSDDPGFDVVRWGLRMRLHPCRNGCEKGALFTPQMYEARERTELFKEIDKAKAAGRTFVFVDIGANVGLFSLLVASHAGTNAKIIAIEPEPGNVQRLRFNVAANPGVPVFILPLAIGETAGRVVLQVDHRDRGGTRTRALSADDATSTPTVECRSLLDILRQEQVTRIDALKIDVEGNEDVILSAFFGEASESLWPEFLIIEDARSAWRSDLFSALAERSYIIAARTRLNVMMRRCVTRRVCFNRNAATTDAGTGTTVPG